MKITGIQRAKKQGNQVNRPDTPSEKSVPREKPSAGDWTYRSALVIVAHPDDEILWAGGTMLMHPETQWTVVALCRQSDPDRAPKFRQVLQQLGATGNLGDLDDGPEQRSLTPSEVQDAVLALVDRQTPDLIMTHSISGEYTCHRRHEETGRAVLNLWDAGLIRSRELWTFAYGDAGGKNPIEASKNADRFTTLPSDIWERKRDLISNVYGFTPGSFELHAALREEAFNKARPLTT